MGLYIEPFGKAAQIVGGVTELASKLDQLRLDHQENLKELFPHEARRLDYHITKDRVSRWANGKRPSPSFALYLIIAKINPRPGTTIYVHALDDPGSHFQVLVQPFSEHRYSEVLKTIEVIFCCGPQGPLKNETSASWGWLETLKAACYVEEHRLEEASDWYLRASKRYQDLGDWVRAQLFALSSRVAEREFVMSDRASSAEERELLLRTLFQKTANAITGIGTTAQKAEAFQSSLLDRLYTEALRLLSLLKDEDLFVLWANRAINRKVFVLGTREQNAKILLDKVFDPANTSFRYANKHYRFVAELAEEVGIRLQNQNLPSADPEQQAVVENTAPISIQE